ncbi:hypothetical protein F5Y15DRAFT_260986 [Xylariaceae sp. FL0016]|nr:hypothetical protein F5Y15DRAFT_260986 [Xylariaceae sp. FL0016]
MPAFSAINVEPEENIDEEVDNTRELHIDEALKRYQTALKLHAQGPSLYPDAAAAYETLFESEIFRYPDSATEFDRAERQSDSHHHPLELSLVQALEAQQADTDGSGSSLPQTLYLAYKNHGQFALDGIRYRAKTTQEGPSSLLTDEDALALARQALTEFGIALDHDPSDAELWRRAARVAAYLTSPRISRYCLEAAIELDDDPAVAEVEPPSLAEAFAGEQLKAQLNVLSDSLALTHPIMAPFVRKRLSKALARHLDPLPYLPNPTESLAPPPMPAANGSNQRCPLSLPVASWAGLGIALVHHVVAAGQPGEAITIDSPETSQSPEPQDEPMLSEPAERNAPEDNQTLSNTPETDPTTQLKDDDAESPTEAAAGHANASTDQTGEPSAPSQPRKRSQSAAGIPEGTDEEVVEKRSKRTRRRETAGGEAVDSNALLAAQLQPFQAADQNLFQMTRNIIENLGVVDRDTLDRLGDVLDSCASEMRTSKLARQPMTDLRDSLIGFNEEATKVLLSKKESAPIGFSSFLEHSKPGTRNQRPMPDFHETKGLKTFIRKVNDGWVNISDVAFEWAQHVCSTYLTSKWSDPLKTAVVQVISHLDAEIHHRIQYELETSSYRRGSREMLESIDHMVQILFELHLDVYERITNPNSAVDFAIRVETKGRLGRWFSFAAQRRRERAESGQDNLSIRFLWSAVFAVTLTEGVSRDHVLQCWKSLRDRLAEEPEDFDLRLPNNAIMPEVSVHAADREISKLTTMDFFLGLFQNDLKDPLSVIESLEPVLNPSSVCTSETPVPVLESVDGNGNGEVSKTPNSEQAPISETANQGLRDLWKFLLGTSTELRLFLWTRLGEAYSAIDYKTKHFSCILRSIEMTVNDFERDPYLKAADETRKPLFIRMLKFLDELLITALSTALNDATAFEIVDDEHLKSSISAVAKLGCILHVTCMYEDEVRVGMRHHRSTGLTFQSYLNKLREMQVRNWSLLYALVKIGIAQNSAGFTAPENDRADYLAAVHQVLGLRKFCKSSNKIFLKMMRVELLKQSMIDNWEDYLGQVLFDLYGLKLGVGLSEVQDHGCPPEKLERRNTLALVERVAMLAKRIPMKDLLKSDLKTTIEHMQQAIGPNKSNQQLIHNLRIFTSNLSKTIDPLQLYGAFKGSVCIDAVQVHTTDSALAKHGWFFLLGMIAFTKFKGVDLNRRQTPGATDDLRMGATFLRQQLQFTPERWEAWFRLAECFDYELDEAVLWTADKMNKERAELVRYQRSAIHCYTLGLSHSRIEVVGLEGESLDALHDLYHKFGMRMYASSREPFAMEPFHSDQKRYYIHSTGTDTKDAHPVMREFKVWKFAAKLFKKAMDVQPMNWKNPYMYAKCLWKMYQRPSHLLDRQDIQNRPSVRTIVAALEKSIEVVYARPKARTTQDPILEPHYKIVSVVYKLVQREDLGPQEAADILQRQPLAVHKGEHVDINEREDWEAFVIKTLIHLREKDRSNWQHRIVIRHARILYNEEAPTWDDQYVNAMAAFTVLKESMLTKTMVMNVWKCDAERPGRHHVYTERYARFVVKLLVELKDRTNFEALLRRLRKKGADFYHFNELWHSCCAEYLRLVRKAHDIPYTDDDEFKQVGAEEFDITSNRISDWCAEPETSHPALNALQEAVELKKLNIGLMKAAIIDDVICDAYSMLYFQIRSTLSGPPISDVIMANEQERLREEARRMQATVDHKPANPFTSILNPQSNENSGTEGLPGDTTPATTEGPQRPRKTGVRKADILRKAEQAVLRSQEGPKPLAAKSRSISSGKTPAAEGDTGAPEVVDDTVTADAEDASDAESGREQHDSEDVEMKADADDVDDADDEERPHAIDQDHDMSSAPASVHDSADDESDLSDVPSEDLLDEEEAQALMRMRHDNEEELEEMDMDEGEEVEGEDEEEDDGEELGDEDEETEDDEEAEEGDEEEIDEDDDEEEAEEVDEEVTADQIEVSQVMEGDDEEDDEEEERDE